MAKRRLSKQQKRRIAQSQSEIDLSDQDHLTAVVISHRGKQVEVEPEAPALNAPEILFCSFRSNLGTLVCGDRVAVKQEQNEATIVAILPRENLLIRKDGFDQKRLLAANITQVIICLAVVPQPNLFLLDQYLVAAEQQQLECLILLNKTDLLDQAQTDPFELNSIYGPLGYRLLFYSCKTEPNLTTLRQQCKNQVSVISGVSGVGKSSITQQLVPQADIETAEISASNQEGRHTTRSSRLYHLEQGGDLIDTPGVRGFNPLIEKDQRLDEYFPELRTARENCKFANCSHLHEPGCAVIKAIDQGIVSQKRYDSYFKLCQEVTKR